MNIMNRFTARTLKKNKTRTIVTIIGIILSLSMFTAVTTSIVSLQSFLLNLTTDSTGNWHGMAYDLPTEKIEELQLSDEIESLSLMQGVGFADLPQSKNPDKQLLHVTQVNETFLDEMAVHLTEGTMPKNENELIVSTQVNTTGQLNYKIGDTITLSLGELQFKEGFTLKDNYHAVGQLEDEKLNVTTHTYTIVGFMQQPIYESYGSLAFSAITLNQENTATTAFFTLEKPKHIFEFMKATFTEEQNVETNSDYLRMLGISGSEVYNSILYTFGAILIAIIMFGSISLIYNSFSISVSERTKNFGLLKSIGATKKQLLNSILFEATTLSIIGIPIGILAGIAGIGVTLHLLEDTFAKFINVDTNTTLSLVISWEAIAIAALIGFITVIISAYIPARRASKINVISAIKQTNDIKLTAKQVRVSPITKWLFGFEGTLASKYFKRNKKSYRATVISIFMSIVLFISASTLTLYLTNTTDDLMTETDFDLKYEFAPGAEDQYTIDDVYYIFKNDHSIKEITYANSNFLKGRIPINLLEKDYVSFLEKEQNKTLSSEYVDTSFTIHFLDQISYEAYVKEQNLDTEMYLTSSAPPPIILDFLRTYSSVDNRYLTFHLLNEEHGNLLYFLSNKNNATFSHIEIDETGIEYAYFFDYKNQELIKYPKEEVLTEKQATYFDVLDEAPFGLNGNGLSLIYPISSIPTVLETAEEDLEQKNFTFYLSTDEPYETYNRLNQILIENNWDNYRLNNIHEGTDAVNALITTIKVFCYGFIVLISLISVANIFNTISTNIHLRRREFAMLRSVGMTISGIKKMLNLECLMYGLKGIMYGIPVSLGVSYGIYKSIDSGLNIGFIVPWASIAISIVCVFLFVFASMLFAMNRIKKDNPMETLRNETL